MREQKKKKKKKKKKEKKGESGPLLRFSGAGTDPRRCHRILVVRADGPREKRRPRVRGSLFLPRPNPDHHSKLVFFEIFSRDFFFLFRGIFDFFDSCAFISIFCYPVLVRQPTHVL
jgi:hypothetical protein